MANKEMCNVHIVMVLAVMAMVCGRHCQFCGRHRLWPSLSNPYAPNSTQNSQFQYRTAIACGTEI